MDGIIVGRSPTSNALLVYNPRTKQYYEPDSYRIDSYPLPGLVYSNVKYDGGLFCSLLRDDNPSFEEKYPPGTRVERIDPSTNLLLAGTVTDIPFPTDVSDSTTNVSYTILFNMVQLPLFLSLKCLPFCRCHPSMLRLAIHRTHFSLPSCVSTRR